MFDWLKKKSPKKHQPDLKPSFHPAQLPPRRNDPPTIQIRDTLFGDMPLDHWPRNGVNTELFPWSAFVSAQKNLSSGDTAAAVQNLREVLAHSGLESRQYLQAWHFLRQQGEKPPSELAKQVLGIVVEVAMPQGVDLLAAYSDYSARYYNFSGAAVIWEHPDSSLNSTIDQLFEASRIVIGRIGPWEQPRLAAPPRDHARLSFLTPSGLHFGQGPISAFSKDPLGGRVLTLATILMKELIAKANTVRNPR